MSFLVFFHSPLAEQGDIGKDATVFWYQDQYQGTSKYWRGFVHKTKARHLPGAVVPQMQYCTAVQTVLKGP